eukprot:gnl/TRDRNA2_/TRDRNA2_173683_c11_seq1.p2 gnl/TRDRNA2_/TRDRNA2_173683_c11~~gnl/TRDRNA2_/TRDRNA2_173683_c11_seq1.p2  ORF type:complete len:102 (-),score=11.07 gnl/TRDRNA2_/TRDRNA2_173683_c11_seq1:682-987(-)
MAWGFARADHLDMSLFRALARCMVERCVDDRNAQHLANAAWAYATVTALDERLFTALARTARQRIGDFSAQGVANTSWAFARVNRWMKSFTGHWLERRNGG